MAFRYCRDYFGIWDVDGWLAAIPQALLNEWRAFDELEPDGQVRTDWGLAHVVQAIMRNGKSLDEFMLPFGDFPKPQPVVQTIEYQTMVIDAWIFGSNALHSRKKG